MLTALQIEEKRSGILRLLRRNRLRVEHSFCDSASVKSITYEHYRGKIGWGAIDRFVKAQRNRLLCPPGLELPSELGYRRFESEELSRRMCENAALYLLRHIDGARTVLIDPNGSCGSLCEELAGVSEMITVLTEDTDFYRDTEDRLLSERGAVLNIRKSGECLRKAELIIAPGKLERSLPCSASAVILSGERPAAPQPVPVIFMYYLELPFKLKNIKPPYLDDMYFASALYSAGGVSELGSELFYRCSDGTTVHTRQSLTDMLNRLTDRRKNSD